MRSKMKYCSLNVRRQMKTVSLCGREAQRFLNGFFCVYKPKDVSISALQRLITTNLCRDVNSLDQIVVPEIEVPIVKPHPRTGALLVVGTRTQLDYVQHPLMAGGILCEEDIRIEPLSKLQSPSSGVCLFGINDGCDELDSIRERCWLNEYQLQGTFGIEKRNHEIRGATIAKAQYDHVTELRLQKLLTRLRFQFKRLSYELAGVERGSQEEFELVRRGAPRPRLHGTPVIYDIALRRFEPPNFALHLHIVGETDYFLRALIHEIGCGVESVACPRRIRRIREGPFTAAHALLERQLSLVPILRNIQMCNKIARTAMSRDSDVIEMKKSDNDAMNADKLLIEFGLEKELRALPEPEDCFRISWGRNYD